MINSKSLALILAFVFVLVTGNEFSVADKESLPVLINQVAEMTKPTQDISNSMSRSTELLDNTSGIEIEKKSETTNKKEAKRLVD